MNIEDAINVEFERIPNNEAEKILREQRKSENFFYKEPYNESFISPPSFGETIIIGLYIGLYLFL